MTTTRTQRGSAYPAVEQLLPNARALATQLGRLPSRNQLMRELRVGARKASQLLANLTTDPARTWPASTAAAGAAPPSAIAADAVTERPVRAWPVVVLALPAFVAIWSGWVGLGGLTGFGVVHPLPGIWDGLAVNTAITLPIGMETYAAFALRAWLSNRASRRARRFAKWSAIAALALGAAGQVAYHLMTAAGVTAAPWPITTVVACLPVAVLGMGAALAHLLHQPEPAHEPGSGEVPW
jgi:hypothetical protein